jgi:hypothetical protein
MGSGGLAKDDRRRRGEPSTQFLTTANRPVKITQRDLQPFDSLICAMARAPPATSRRGPTASPLVTADPTGR